MDRFISMQRREFSLAFNEIKRGRKINHWIWYIFPQIKGLGHSYMCQKYDIQSLDEAKKYLENEYLRNNLIKISKELLNHKDKDIKEIMNIDDIKLLSCMTLFKEADKEVNKCGTIFQQVINTFYGGKEDEKTISILNRMENNNKAKDTIINEEEIIKTDKGKKNNVNSKSERYQDGDEMDVENENLNEGLVIRSYERNNTNDLNALTLKNKIEQKKIKEKKVIINNIKCDTSNKPNDNIIKNNIEKSSIRNYYKSKKNNEDKIQTKITDYYKKVEYYN